MSDRNTYADSTINVRVIEQPKAKPRRDSSSCCDCLRVTGAVSFAFFIIILMLVFAFGISLTQLVIGSLYKNKCPIDKMIPIYLIVAGVFGFITAMVTTCMKLAKDANVLLLLLIPLYLFNFAWFIAGNVWVFKAKGNVQFHDSSLESTYCDNRVFNCAYATIIITYVFSTISMCCSCLNRSG